MSADSLPVFAEASGCTVNEECQCVERMFCQYRVIPPDMPTKKTQPTPRSINAIETLSMP